MSSTGMVSVNARDCLAEFDLNSIPAPDPIRTGFPDLDRATGGLFGREIMTLASEDRQLRTSILQKILWNAAVNQSLKVLYVTSRDTPAFVLRKAILDPCPQQFSRTRTCPQGTEARLNALKKANPVVLSIEKAPVDRQIRKLWELCEDQSPDVLLLDDIQGCITSYRDSIYADLSMLSRNLKWLIGTNEVPLIMTSELNRYRHHRDTRSNELYDLRDSGVLEDDADFVIFLSRQGQTRGSELKVDASIKKSRCGPSNRLVNL